MSALVAFVGLALPAIAQEKSETGVKQNPLKDAYFGETHLHTGVSMDAFIGGTRLTPDDVKTISSTHDLPKPDGANR